MFFPIVHQPPYWCSACLRSYTVEEIVRGDVNYGGASWTNETGSEAWCDECLTKKIGFVHFEILKRRYWYMTSDSRSTTKFLQA